MCNLSEGIYERGMSQGMAQGAENKLIEVIMNLWNAGTDMATIKIASGWTEEQIMKVVKKNKL
ncbi:hypothetical protein [Selenomonas ruminantium]|uniref:Uncharacterized protein n=1 Tax=Selenomonas ruminantium TaxID=971 RepID=A0A1H3VUM9_SELRU|nr:hypothetical protein [Selenomonas ruminantium]SDZ77822.1 hypothetical protein SAMN05660648_00546 [Selenomonas ruminantium]